MQSIPFSRRLPGFIAAGIQVFCLLSGSPATAAEPVEKFSWNRTVLIGASVSAGFTLTELFGGTNTLKHRLSYYLEAAMLTPHLPVRNLAHNLFFMQPEEQGRSQVERAAGMQPTLVVGIDFLFWFCYGEGLSDQERLARFNRGLKLLEQFNCSLVVGDIPDASGAMEEMLPRAAIPNAKTLAAANQRLKEWAATRKNVIVVPLSEFLRKVMANEALAIRKQSWPRGETRSLLQADRLHPTPRGCAALAVVIMDALQTALPAISTRDIQWNADEILRRATTLAEATIKPPAKPLPERPDK